MQAAETSAKYDKAFFGHPRGLSTLFFTEMWERFSYYGIRAILILYMTATVANHGMGLDVATAGAIYGLFTSCVYVFGLPAGWIADRFTGHQKSIVIGGLFISAGNFGLMAPSLGTFVLALLLIAIGTGFLKTSCTTVVGALYRENDVRRDAGFSLYYVGINLGAFLAPLVCGYVGQRIDFRYGFGLAGLFMILGLIQFSFTRGFLGQAGRAPVVARDPGDRKILTFGVVVLAVIVAALVMIRASVERIADGFGTVLLITAVATFVGLLMSKNFSPVEKRRIQAVIVLFIASALFWSIYEQAGSTLNLFADRNTNNRIFGLEYPSSWFQAFNPILIFIMAPLAAWFWVKLGDKDPSVTTKFGLGLLGVGGGFVVMVAATNAAGVEGKVGPGWLAACYLLQTLGELCLSPVGLSAMTKLAPARIAGFMMGLWFLSISVGNFFAGRLASFYETLPLPKLFGYAGMAAIAAGVVLFLIARPVTRLMGGVK